MFSTFLCFFPIWENKKMSEHIWDHEADHKHRWNQVLHILISFYKRDPACSEGAARRFFYQRLKEIWKWYMIYDIWYMIWFFHDDLPNFTRFFHDGSYLSNPLLWSLGWFMIPWVQAALQVPNAMLQRSSKLTGAKVTTLKVKNCFSTYKMIEGSLEVKLPTIWTDEKQSRGEAERRGRLEERRWEEKESEERRYRCAKR